jgi:hypothetical protein
MNFFFTEAICITYKRWDNYEINLYSLKPSSSTSFLLSYYFNLLAFFTNFSDVTLYTQNICSRFFGLYNSCPLHAHLLEKNTFQYKLHFRTNKKQDSQLDATITVY